MCCDEGVSIKGMRIQHLQANMLPKREHAKYISFGNQHFLGSYTDNHEYLQGVPSIVSRAEASIQFKAHRTTAGF